MNMSFRLWPGSVESGITVKGDGKYLCYHAYELQERAKVSEIWTNSKHLFSFREYELQVMANEQAEQANE